MSGRGRERKRRRLMTAGVGFAVAILLTGCGVLMPVPLSVPRGEIESAAKEAVFASSTNIADVYTTVTLSGYTRSLSVIITPQTALMTTGEIRAALVATAATVPSDLAHVDFSVWGPTGEPEDSVFIAAQLIEAGVPEEDVEDDSATVPVSWLIDYFGPGGAGAAAGEADALVPAESAQLAALYAAVRAAHPTVDRVGVYRDRPGFDVGITLDVKVPQFTAGELSQTIAAIATVNPEWASALDVSVYFVDPGSEAIDLSAPAGELGIAHLVTDSGYSVVFTREQLAEFAGTAP